MLKAKNKVEGAVRYAAQTTHKKSLMHVNLIKQAEQSFPFGSGENLPVASWLLFRLLSVNLPAMTHRRHLIIVLFIRGGKQESSPRERNTNKHQQCLWCQKFTLCARGRREEGKMLKLKLLFPSARALFRLFLFIFTEKPKPLLWLRRILVGFSPPPWRWQINLLRLVNHSREMHKEKLWKLAQLSERQPV
jgi:hypothetical protein